MEGFKMAEKKVKVNRAPVLTLWAAVVAERLGYEPEEALTLGRSLAGLNAQSKGRRLGIYEEPKEDEAEKKAPPPEPENLTYVEVLGRKVPALKTEKGVRAVEDGHPIAPESVQRYLEGKFKNDYTAVRAAMQALAGSYDPDELSQKAFRLYESFRPEVPEGTRGWGALGELDLERLRKLEK
jgi:hypothetical protein